MDEDYDSLALTQRYKAAVHYTTGQICEEVGEDKQVEFTKQFIAVLSEATFKYSKTLATDLELFAKHAKRSVINQDDVKLAVRKSPTLLDHLVNQCPPEEKKPKKARASKKKSTAKGTAEPDDQTEESNMAADG